MQNILLKVFYSCSNERMNLLHEKNYNKKAVLQLTKIIRNMYFLMSQLSFYVL